MNVLARIFFVVFGFLTIAVRNYDPTLFALANMGVGLCCGFILGRAGYVKKQ